MSKPTTTTEASSTAASASHQAADLNETQGLQSSEPRKKKKKYSSILSRTIQELDKGLAKSARKVAEAVREGVDEYEARRSESAGKKKDGALRDLLRNQSKALRKSLPIAAEAPSELLDAVADSKVVRRLTAAGKRFGK